VYEPQREPSGCMEIYVLTRAAFGILIWPMLALFAVLGMLMLAFVLFSVHPALALLPIAAIILGVVLFARWEQKRFRPPGL
jgi:hypothetical protein